MEQLLETPMRPVSLVDALVERLEAAILCGELAPGARLREQAIARKLGVSRGPLREAIRRLEGRRLIQRRPQIGASVAAITRDELEEMLTIREVLEGAACRLAAERITPAELERLRGILAYQRHRQAAGRLISYFQEPRELDFHHALVTASRSPRLLDLLYGDLFYLLRVHRYRAAQLPGRAPESLDEHGRIIEALTAREGERAEALMRAHLRAARAATLRAMMAAEEAPEPPAAEPADYQTLARGPVP